MIYYIYIVYIYIYIYYIYIYIYIYSIYIYIYMITLHCLNNTNNQILGQKKHRWIGLTNTFDPLQMKGNLKHLKLGIRTLLCTVNKLH